MFRGFFENLRDAARDRYESARDYVVSFFERESDELEDQEYVVDDVEQAYDDLDDARSDLEEAEAELDWFTEELLDRYGESVIEEPEPDQEPELEAWPELDEALSQDEEAERTLDRYEEFYEDYLDEPEPEPQLYDPYGEQPIEDNYTPEQLTPDIEEIEPDIFSPPEPVTIEDQFGIDRETYEQVIEDPDPFSPARKEYESEDYDPFGVLDDSAKFTQPASADRGELAQWIADSAGIPIQEVHELSQEQLESLDEILQAGVSEFDAPQANNRGDFATLDELMDAFTYDQLRNFEIFPIISQYGEILGFRLIENPLGNYGGL